MDQKVHLNLAEPRSTQQLLGRAVPTANACPAGLASPIIAGTWTVSGTCTLKPGACKIVPKGCQNGPGWRAFKEDSSPRVEMLADVSLFDVIEQQQEES